MIILKAKPAPEGKSRGRKGTVTYEIDHKFPDKWSKNYPSADDCYIIVSATANSGN